MIAHRMLIIAILAIIVRLVRAEEGLFQVYGRDETPAYSDSKCYFLNSVNLSLTRRSIWAHHLL